MPCTEWTERLIDFVVGEADPEESIRIAQHLAECPGCGAEEESLRTLLARSEEDDWTPSAEFASILFRKGRRADDAMRLRDDRGGPSPWRWIARPLPAYAALLIVFAALAGGYSVGTRHDRSGDGGTSPHETGVEQRETGAGGDPDGSDRGPHTNRERSPQFMAARVDAVALQGFEIGDSL